MRRNHMLETKADFERARASLERHTPQELTEFILSLADASNGIAAYVSAFALAADTKSTSEIIDAEMAVLARGEREYDYRHRQSFEVSARADRTLHAIEKMIAPRDASVAARLLLRFIALEESILSNCYEDDGAGKTFVRARELLKVVST